MKTLVKKLKENHHSNNNFIDEVAMVLDIKYDAAYRRVSGIAKFSLEEALLLSQHFSVSLDELKTTHNDLFFLENKYSLKNIHSIAHYIEESYQSLKPFFTSTSTHITYCSKDIPIFYTLGNSILSRFKMYCWCWMLDPKFASIRLSFADFYLPAKLIESGEKLTKGYESVSVAEFWNETILNSTLYQVKYFLELGVISNYEAEKICEELKHFLLKIETKLSPSPTSTRLPAYEIYVNELLLMNNSILFQDAKNTTMLVPLTIIGFIEIDNTILLKEQVRYYTLQKQNSISLSGGNQKIRTLFFKKLYAKIENTLREIKNIVN